MCCDAPGGLVLPPAVAAMLDEYRTHHAERPADWGAEGMGAGQAVDYARWLSAALLFAQVDDDWPATVRGCLADPPPPGLVVATLTDDGAVLRAGPPPHALPGAAVEVAVLLDSRLPGSTRVEVDGVPVRVAAGGVELVPLSRPEPWTLTVGSATAPAGRSATAGRLRLHAGAPSRWSVVDDRGGAWFPHDAPRRWDFHGRGVFHGDDLVLDVPAVPLTVSCGRGMEFDTAETTVTPTAGATIEVELAPARRYETATRGWFGADLHVHMNYSGDVVCTPEDAACMQRGEGLHLMQLVAGNFMQTRVYDREAFEATVGQDLPWSGEDRVARFGVEYRNDLLGHFHALGPTRAPTRYFTGPTVAEQPIDWPANAVACEEFQAQGAVVGYTHPVFSPLSDGSPAEAFTTPRSVEARELVADAALGLVDSVDLIGPSDVEGTAILYHHLLNCGLRLAATAGTDVWLSHSRGPLIANPPGWARVYADLRGAPLSVAAFMGAIRAGRTLATNGPWLELNVEGRGPGDVLEAEAGQTLRVSARAQGPGVERLELLGPDGVLAGGAGPLDVTLTLDGPLWLCAVARGPQHPSVLGPVVFAHTSPVHVEVAGRAAIRADSARWLLDWLDRFETLVRSDGQFADDTQRDEVVAVIDRARPFYRALAAR